MTPSTTLNTPSVVAFGDDGEIRVGAGAERHGRLDPRSTVRGVKRLLARRFDSPFLQSLAARALRDRRGREPGGPDPGGRQGPPSKEILARLLTRLRVDVNGFVEVSTLDPKTGRATNVAPGRSLRPEATVYLTPEEKGSLREDQEALRQKLRRERRGNG